MTPGEKNVIVATTEPADPDAAGDKKLYIAVYAPPQSIESRYLLIHWDEQSKYGIIRGVPNAATYSIFVVLGICVCLSLLGAVLFVLIKQRRGKQSAAGSPNDRGQPTELMPGQQLTNDYPSMQDQTVPNAAFGGGGGGGGCK